MSEYEVIEAGGVPIKAWTKGVPVEAQARQQLGNISRLPFVFRHVAVMPDVHLGKGATVGSVIPTKGAIVPAAVGVDIGCGMAAVRTNIRAADLPDGLAPLRSAIEAAVPHGGPGVKGSWIEKGYRRPTAVAKAFGERYPSGKSLAERLDLIVEKHDTIAKAASIARDQLGTLGGGNHFVEICLDESDRVWVMLHSGSRGVGNKIGSVFIERAKEHIATLDVRLPDRDLAWLDEGMPAFDDYVVAVGWAQDYARANRALMMESVLGVLRTMFPQLAAGEVAVNCHHNYVAREEHFGERVWVTRKGAVRAGAGELGIIPGSMGARSFIVRGKGNAESFETCSHGAGRTMSRAEAKRRFTLEDHAQATAHVECRKDAGVIDETPAAYKDIDAVMAAQAELVEIVHTLRQVVCVKG
jgi:tRNA-splicing ligase RtcB